MITDEIEAEALRRVDLKRFGDWMKNIRNHDEIMEKATSLTEPSDVANFIASQLPVRLVVRQQVLELTDVNERLRKVAVLLDTEVDIANLESELNMEVRGKMDKQQKEYYLREKIKAIHEELGDKVDKDTEVDELRKKIKGMHLAKKIEEPLLKEVDRLDSMPPMMAESAIIRTYLDTALELPWKKETKDRLNLQEAQDVLDADHYGLKKVKERIIEFLAVKQLTNSLKGPILCFVGPPGTGKTSIARSIARAMNRKYVRVSLGGVRDEAEIRGHRRTYIGAMPGRIISGMKQVGVKNPVFLLDEVDKMTSDMRGDPSAALLEVLDPEQNNAFSDHFLEIPFDLSKVFWITTANVVSDIPRPLLDRMEIIEFSSYTEDEKVEIAKQYLMLTGQLGDVMKESAEAGMTYIRRRADVLGIPEDFYTNMDIHIHLPEGAIPKDGPSAGITMATALASALTGKAVRHDVAMTGEITLRGTVLPVGGIKEKVNAAHRAGIKKILLPEANKRDMVDVPQSVKDDVKFVFVNNMDQVLEQALVKS